MRHAIFDLDNCLSDDLWRQAYIKWDEQVPSERYDRYHRGCGLDQPANLDVFNEYYGPYKIVFLTGRPVYVREQTIVWIKNHLKITSPILLMRNNFDQRKSVDVKFDMMKDLRYNYGIEPQVAFDDRPEIIQMYRDHGMEVHQLFIHHPDLAYIRPSLDGG
jgi:hypothetical protein